MALSHSPRIVTDGLVLCLDSANTKSYFGSWSPALSNGANAFDGDLSTFAGALGEVLVHILIQSPFSKN